MNGSQVFLISTIGVRNSQFQDILEDPRIKFETFQKLAVVICYITNSQIDQLLVAKYFYW